MEFKEMLQKLKYSSRFNRSSLTKEIIANVHNVNKTELLDILGSLLESSDIEYQVKLISILTAYLVYNNTNRDVIIRTTALYDTIGIILARGLQLKTTITLNFITSLLYGEDDGGSRSKTLTLHAQNFIRNSGCLTAITHLFTNYMLHTGTWQALCRCLAEVCRGCELNQNFCSHFVPLCVQQCLQGNADVLPVLQSLLFNHKHNTHLFLETDGATIFNRKDILRLPACLELLNTVINNAKVEAISTMAKGTGIRENLLDLLKMNSINTSIVQWTTIVLYHLDLKLKEGSKCYNATRNFKQNILPESNVDETHVLLQNIMIEILSYPSETHGHNLLNNSIKVPNKLSNQRDISRIAEAQYNEYKSLDNKISPPLNSNIRPLEKLSFTFLMNESSRIDQGNPNSINSDVDNFPVKQTILDYNKFNQSRENCENFLCDTLKTFNSKSDFKPIFFSTPKRFAPNILHTNTTTKRSFIRNNRSIDRTIIKKLPKRAVSQEKRNMKHRSMSSRIFEAINESCTTVINSVKRVFTGNKHSNTTKRDTANNSANNEDQKSHCSFSFTNYMQRREAELRERNTILDLSREMQTLNTVNVCNTCDNTLLLRQKLSSDEQLKRTVKKLKLGINLYGCDFKRISKTMWPRDSYMTPNVLHNLYRKLLLK